MTEVPTNHTGEPQAPPFTVPSPCQTGAPEIHEQFAAGERDELFARLAVFGARLNSSLCEACGDQSFSVDRHCEHPDCPMLVARCDCGEVPSFGLIDVTT